MRYTKYVYAVAYYCFDSERVISTSFTDYQGVTYSIQEVFSIQVVEMYSNDRLYDSVYEVEVKLEVTK